jgi:hypothetical protein
MRGSAVPHEQDARLTLEALSVLRRQSSAERNAGHDRVVAREVRRIVLRRNHLGCR